MTHHIQKTQNTRLTRRVYILGSHTTYISSLSTNSKLYDARYRGTVIGILLFAYGIRCASVPTGSSYHLCTLAFDSHITRHTFWLASHALSALQFTAIYSTFFDPDVPSFLLCAALLCGGIDLVGSFLLLPSGGGAHGAVLCVCVLWALTFADWCVVWALF